MNRTQFAGESPRQVDEGDTGRMLQQLLQSYARGQRVPREFLDGLFERLRLRNVVKAVRE